MKLLTPKQVSEQLAVSRATAQRMIVEGIIPSIVLRSGKRKKIWRVRPEQLDKWRASKEKASRSEKEGQGIDNSKRHYLTGQRNKSHATKHTISNPPSRIVNEPVAGVSTARNGHARDTES